MRRIRGESKNLHGLLANARFDVDDYQREYRWEQDQVSALVADLSNAFFKRHGAERLADYERYFLGSIVISEHEGRRFIIDGQQRLTTLTLMLIHLHRNLEAEHQKHACKQLVFSYHPEGGASFNLDIEERRACMETLLDGSPFDDDGDESVVNMLARYQDVESCLMEELRTGAQEGVDREADMAATLSRFTDWLMTNVDFVEITADTDADAYSIFETMNDRGLSLTPSEMLKGHLLSRIDRANRKSANDVWRKRVQLLRDSYSAADANAIKAWLLGRHARSEYRPADIEEIRGQFHRWVRDNHQHLGLVDGDAFRTFIEGDFDFYGRWYGEIIDASWSFKHASESGLEVVFRNQQANFRHRNPLMLAALRPTDDDETVRRKLRTVGAYIEILVARYAWLGGAYNRPEMYKRTLALMTEIRELEPDELAEVLERPLRKSDADFPADAKTRYDWQNGRRFHRLLARMMDYLDQESWRASEAAVRGEPKPPSLYAQYVQPGYASYEVEHVWADHFERHVHEFRHEADFQAQRNRIGALLLVPGWVNNRLRDKTYAVKREHEDPEYSNLERWKDRERQPVRRNRLVLSLVKTRDECEREDPVFSRFVERSGLPFFREEPERFQSGDVDARQALYAKLAKRIWSVEEIHRAAAS